MSTISDEILSIIRSTFSRLKIPSTHDKVYNDECILTFDSPFSDNGIYINIITHQGYGHDVIKYDISKGGCVYLNQKWIQTLKKDDNNDNNDINNGPNKLAIGIPGGFITESKYDIIKEYSIIVIDNNKNMVRLPFPNPELPEFLSSVINGIIQHNGMKSKMQENQWEADQDKVISKYAANLVQVNNDKKISNDPKSWKCELRGDTENLWLNLSTGYIGGGRKNWDGTGGSGGALQHYLDTGKQYPLCAKLGTITPNGADVWSYADDEDTLVIDPNLGKHLAHWGIDIMKLDKTDKSLGEMEVDLNMKYDWSRILEDGETLQLRSGPGSIGLRNIGSSCYMNSVLQILVAMPEVTSRYYDKAADIITSAPSDPTSDFACQFSKVVTALCSSRYAPPLKDPSAMITIENGENSIDESAFEKYVVAPRMFKQLVGKGHAEFSGGRQQDAAEYLSFLLDVMSKAEKTSLRRIDSSSSLSTSSIFDFNLEYKFVCPITGQVKYKTEQNSLVNLFIPLDRAVNKDQVEQETKKARIEETSLPNEIKPIVPLELCFQSFFGDEQVQMYNTGIQSNVMAKKTTMFKTFPRYLAIILKRYFVNDKWVQVKIDAHIPMPEYLDLSMYKSSGPLPGEEPWTEEAGEANPASVIGSPSALVPDETLVLQLISMGFSENGCKRAAIATKNADVETSMNWIFEHMEDPDFNDPISSSSSAAPASASSNDASSEMIEIIASMGYSADHAKAALKANDNNLERAVDWIFSHMDDLDAAVMEVNNIANTNTVASVDTANPLTVGLDSDGKYSLLGFISHIGKNTESGHYVSHIKKDGEWRLFNDEKVALSTKPPFELGFIYFYRLDDAPETL